MADFPLSLSSRDVILILRECGSGDCYLLPRYQTKGRNKDRRVVAQAVVLPTLPSCCCSIEMEMGRRIWDQFIYTIQRYSMTC